MIDTPARITAVAYPLSDLRRGRLVGGHTVLEVYPEGRGGMARVVRVASAPASAGAMALKISRLGVNSSYFFAALQKEVEILQGLDHPGVVRLASLSRASVVYKERAIEIQGAPWFFGMETLHGGSLESLARGLGPMPVELVITLSAQVARALLHVHRRGFVHNDVKPDNVLFRHPLEPGCLPQAVLIDFGVAARRTRQQQDGSVVYMSPERLLETRHPSPPEAAAGWDAARADVWSLGILMYRMLAGREPFHGVSDRSITSAILRGDPVPVRSVRRDVPRPVEEFLLEGCLAKDPRLRLPMQRAVEFLETRDGEARLDVLPRSPNSWQRWRRRIM
jgi:serine/threonine protein kinase